MKLTINEYAREMINSQLDTIKFYWELSEDNDYSETDDTFDVYYDAHLEYLEIMINKDYNDKRHLKIFQIEMQYLDGFGFGIESLINHLVELLSKFIRTHRKSFDF